MKISTGNTFIGIDNVINDNAVGNNGTSRKIKNFSKLAKSKNLVKTKNPEFVVNSKSTWLRANFLTFKARVAFIQLRQAFIETPTLQYFKLKCHIWIETNTFGYAIGDILT